MLALITLICAFPHQARADDPPAVHGMLVFGAEGDYWLAHVITTEPDFDQILSANAVDLMLRNPGVLKLTILGTSPNMPLEDGGEYVGQSGVETVHLKTISTDYLELGDLSM